MKIRKIVMIFVGLFVLTGLIGFAMNITTTITHMQENRRIQESRELDSGQWLQIQSNTHHSQPSLYSANFRYISFGGHGLRQDGSRELGGVRSFVIEGVIFDGVLYTELEDIKRVAHHVDNGRVYHMERVGRQNGRDVIILNIDRMMPDSLSPIPVVSIEELLIELRENGYVYCNEWSERFIKSLRMGDYEREEISALRRVHNTLYWSHTPEITFRSDGSAVFVHDWIRNFADDIAYYNGRYADKIADFTTFLFGSQEQWEYTLLVVAETPIRSSGGGSSDIGIFFETDATRELGDSTLRRIATYRQGHLPYNVTPREAEMALRGRGVYP